MKSLPVSGIEKNPAIGARLRNHRLRQHITIEQLAEASGLTKGFISRVERDQTSPSVATLVNLCSVLRVEVGALFEEPETTLVELDDAPEVNLGGEGIVERLVSPRNLSKVQVLRGVVEPGGQGESEKYTVDCETEILHVLSGEFTVETSGGVHRLVAGDTLTFPGTEPHTWENSAKVPAEILWILVAA